MCGDRSPVTVAGTAPDYGHFPSASGFPFHPISRNLTRTLPMPVGLGTQIMAEREILLFIGGARSGKSRLAQAEAERRPGRLIYIATAEGLDDEMRERIARHGADRDARWRTIECPIELPATIAREGVDGAVLLIDCLTLWLSNVMLGGHDIAAARAALTDVLETAGGTVILVTNEVGQGIVPDNPLARKFRDEAGFINQRVAANASRVALVIAGTTLSLK